MSEIKRNRESPYETFCSIGNDFVKGIIRGEKRNFCFDPYEEANESLGINYTHWFWEVFGAMEGKKTKSHTNLPQVYIKELLEKIDKEDERELADILLAFAYYGRIIAYLYEAKQGLDHLLEDLSDVIVSFE